jgi:predicted nucleotidyltransferase
MCLLSGIDVSRAILFGSLVSGAAGEDSDIDLLIVSKKFKNNTLENWKIISPISSLFYDVDPHPYPLDKFMKGDPFINEIKLKGIEITID